MEKIKLGDRVKSKISGFQGVVTAWDEFFNGNIRLQVTPDRLKESGEQIEYEWFDDVDLEVVERGVFEIRMPNTTSRNRINFGDRIKDKITGFIGIATGYAIYANGCEQWLIHREKLGKDGKRYDNTWYDSAQVVTVRKNVIFPENNREKRTGGPAEDPSSSYAY